MARRRNVILRLAAASLLNKRQIREEEKKTLNVRVFYLPDLKCRASIGVRFRIRVTALTSSRNNRMQNSESKLLEN